jgi:RNA polymerase sigma-70 factor (ECF subfamily)
MDMSRRPDSRAFTELVREHDQGLRALAYRLLEDRDLMDDALQEAYVKAYRALPAFRGDSSLGTWLYRIAYNACLDELRRSRTVVPLERVEDRPDPAPALPERTATGDLLARALSTLSHEDRAAVLLVDAQGFDYDSAGEVLGVPAGTVASRLNRARAQLRRVLSDDAQGASA